MKPRKRRDMEVPPSIRSFIDRVTASPLEDIERVLRDFVWEYDKGDIHHWNDLLYLFGSYLDKYIGPRKDLSLIDGFLESDMPFPRGHVLQICRVTRLIMENCSNRLLASSLEGHLASLLSSTDADIIEASLQILMVFANKSSSKSLSLCTGSLVSKLFALSQGWGGKDGALGLVACCLPDHIPSEASQLGSTLHFEFYSTTQGSSGLRVIHMPDVNLYRGTDLELLAELIKEHDVPVGMRFALLTRLRFARAFESFTERCRYVCIRLYAFVMLIHMGREHENVETLLGNEPEFIDELLSLLSYDETPEKIRVLAILSLAALCQDRSHTQTTIYSVTSGAHRTVLPGLMQKTIESITTGLMKCSVVFAEALLSLALVLVSSTPGSLALQESGLISTMLPLLKDTNAEHLLLVTTAVQVVEGLLDHHNPSSNVFRDLGGLDDSILRLKSEISDFENGFISGTAEQETSSSQSSSRKGKELESAIAGAHAADSGTILHNRRALIKALLQTISLASFVPGAPARVGGSEESVLPHCLCVIFTRGKEFGGSVFSLAAHVMMDLIHKDPICFPALEAAGLPAAFINVITNGPLCSSDAITCILPCLEALCLNDNGLKMVKDRNALKLFLRIFVSKRYLKVLSGAAVGVISNGLDELLRHAPTLRPYGVDAVIWILDSLAKIGSGSGSNSEPGSEFESPPAVVPMDIDNPMENSDQMVDASITVELFLPGCISNVVRLLEPIVQNSDTCRMFVEKKGLEKVLKLFDLECIPVSLSIGSSVSSAFKNFSPTHSVAMLQIVGSFIREQLKSVNGVLNSAVAGSKLEHSEHAKQMEVLRSLSSLEGLLVLSSFLLKNNTVMMAELAVAEAEILKELAKVYVETTWQLSLLTESKPDQVLNDLGQELSLCGDDSIANVEREIVEASAESAPLTVHSDDITTSTSSTMDEPLYSWNADEALASMVRSAASTHRNGHRHGRLSSLARLRGGARLTRHLEALHAHSDTEGHMSTLENYISLHSGDNKSPDSSIREVLTRLAAAIRTFLSMVVKSLPGRRRTEPTLNPASRCVLTALSQLFLSALSYSVPFDLVSSLSVKCCYLGKVSDDMSALTFDSRRRACNTSIVNGFYVTGTFKEMLKTFEATSQLLWSCPFSIDGNSRIYPSWILETLQSYYKLLEYYVNSSFLLSPSVPQSTKLLVEPIATELSINLFPLPRDPEGFVCMLQSQVLEAVLPVWNNLALPWCPVTILCPLISIMNHIFSGVSEFKQEHGGSGGVNPRIEVAPPIDELTVSTIVEMGFSRARVEEALRNVGSNSVELATDWLFTHPEELVQEDVQLAQALALSLGSNSEPGKEELPDRPSGGDDVVGTTVPNPVLPLDDVLSVSIQVFKNCGESLAFPLGDLMVTLCKRNNGEVRPRVVLYLVQHLRVCPVGPGMNVNLLYPIAHMLALLLSEDGNTREIAAGEGLISVVLGILNLLGSGPRDNDTLDEKVMSTLLLVLDSMLQKTPIQNAETLKEPTSDSVDNNKEKPIDFLCTVLGKPTGYLTDEEGQQALIIACELIKQHVPAVVMQASLQLCARLTKIYSLSTLFLETGGLSSLFNLPSGCMFPGFDSVASVIVRHVIEDAQTLQSAMELEIKHALSGAGSLARGGRVSPQSFLTCMAPLICRDSSVFMKAAASVCQIDSSSGGRVDVIMVKDTKEKDKDRQENKPGDGSTPGRLPRVHKRVPPNLAQVMDQLLELIISYEPKAERDDVYFLEPSFDDKVVPMEIDEPNPKGKTKVDDMAESERSACMARISLVLKLLSEMLLMYSHTVLVLLKRDSEMSQMRGNCGILYHILYNLLPLATKDSKDGSDLRAKLSGRATSFLVALCGRSTEGRRRVIAEIVRALTSLLDGPTGSTSSSTRGSSNGSALLPDKRVWSWCNLVHMILLCNSGSPNSNLSLGCSPDVSRAMIDGGMVQSLATVLKALDLDNPHAVSICNLMLKSLETLTQAANASDLQYDKNKTGGSDDSSGLSIREPGEAHPAADTGTVVAEDQETERDQQIDVQLFSSEDTAIGMGMSMNRGDNGHSHELARSGLVGEDDVGEDEEEEEDEDEDDEDDDDRDDDMGMAGHGAHLIPLADTNPVDEEEYNDDMIEEDDDDDDELTPNRGVIEVRWQGGATGLDQIRLPPEIRVSRGRGFIEIASDLFPGDDTDDLYNLQNPFSIERRRQPGVSGSNRSTQLSRQRSDFTSGFQHPLVARPHRENALRDNQLHPVSQWLMFDNGMPPDGSLFTGDRLVGSGASSQLLGSSLGMESLRIGGRRGTGLDGRWIDDGQPPTSSQAASIAQAMEDHFLSQMQVFSPCNSNPFPRNSNPGQSGDQVETDPLINVPILPSGNPLLDATLDRDNNDPLSENIPVTGEQDENLMPNELNRDAVSDMDSGRSSCHAVITGTQPVPELSDARVNSDADASACANSVGIEVPEVSAGANSVEEALAVNDGYHSPPVPMESNDGYQTTPVPIEVDADTNNVAPGDTNQEADPSDVNHTNNNMDGTNEIDPTFLEALPEYLRAEVLASQQGRQAGGSELAETGATVAGDAAEEIDPEFLAALPPDLQAEVLAQQRAQRIAQSHQPSGQPVDMDNASIIATFPPEIREEVLLTSSEAVLSALPSALLAEAQMLRDRELSRYRSRGSLFGGSQHRLGSSGRRFAMDNHRHQSVMDRGVGVSLVRRVVPTLSTGSRGNSTPKEVEGVPLFDAASLEALIRLFQLAQPLNKGILQRVMLNLCAHSITRRLLIGLIVSMIRPEAGPGGQTNNVNLRRLYGCQCNVVYAQPQSPTGLPPLVLRQLLEILTFLASSHNSVADILSCSGLQSCDVVETDGVKGKDVNSDVSETPLMLFLKLLNTPLFLRSRVFIELAMSLLEVVVNNAVAKIVVLQESENPVESGTPSEIQGMEPQGPEAGTERPSKPDEPNPNTSQPTNANQSGKLYKIMVGLPEPDLRNLCTIMSHEGMPDKVYALAAGVIKKLASVAPCHHKFFSSELATVVRSLSSSAVTELSVLRSDQNLSLHSFLAGSAILRVLQSLCALNSDSYQADQQQQQRVLSDLNSSLEPMWQELSECITVTESKLGQTGDLGPASQPLPPGAEGLLPFIESFFVLCEKLQLGQTVQLDNISNSPRAGGTVTFARIAEKHRRLLNLFIRQNPSLLEKSLSMMLKVPRLIDFDNKRAFFRSRIRQQHDNLVASPVRISVRRAYVLEDSYNQLRLRRYQDLKGRLTVQFQGEEGIDAGGLTREWYQLLSRVIFDKGALLFTTVGNNASFQPNPNSVYQTEHLSYFKFVGRVVAKALFDGQLLDVHFTRSFYKHILGVKVTYHDIEAVDPDYYKNLKWMLENDVSNIPDLTFSMDADEEKHILYEKNQVTDYELKPGGRNIRVTEETKHEYVDLVADHILTNAIRPQTNAFLEGFTELIPRELISIFNDKELELLISGLPEIDLNDLKANSEYIGYSAASPVIQWFWEVVKGFNKEDQARLLQFVTGTSKVPLEGFKALQGISGPQRFQIHKAYGAPERLPSAHTCFNQLDLPEYNSKEQLEEKLLLAVHEASEGFGFG